MGKPSRKTLVQKECRQDRTESLSKIREVLNEHIEKKYGGKDGV